MIAFLLWIVPQQQNSRDPDHRHPDENESSSSSSITSSITSSTRLGTLRLSPQSSPQVPKGKSRINTDDDDGLHQQQQHEVEDEVESIQLIQLLDRVAVEGHAAEQHSYSTSSLPSVSSLSANNPTSSYGSIVLHV